MNRLLFIALLTLLSPSILGQQQMFRASHLYLEYENEELKELNRIEDKFTKKAKKRLKQGKSSQESAFHYPLFPGDWTMPLTDNEMLEYLPEKSIRTNKYELSLNWSDDLTYFEIRGFSRMYQYEYADRLYQNEDVVKKVETPIFKIPFCQMQLYFIEKEDKDSMLTYILSGLGSKSGVKVGNSLYQREIKNNSSIPQYQPSMLGQLGLYYLEEAAVKVYEDPGLGKVIDRRKARHIKYFYEQIIRQNGEEDSIPAFIDSVRISLVEKWSLSIRFYEGEDSWTNPFPYLCRSPGYLPVLIREPVSIATHLIYQQENEVKIKTVYFEYQEIMEKLDEYQMNKESFESVMNAQLIEKLGLRFRNRFEY